MDGGLVYIPNKKWAHELIDIVSEFPNGAPPSSDLTDTITQAVLYLKNRHWVEHPDDEEDENTMPQEDIDPDDIDLIDSDAYESGIYG